MQIENTNDIPNSGTDQTDQSQVGDQATASGSTETDQTASEADAKTLLGGAEDDKGGDPKPDEKPDDKDGEGDGKPEPNALLGAPEGDYEISGLPEGVTVDTAALAALAPVAKEIGLSNEGMSRLAQVYTSDILPHVAQQMQADVEAQHVAIRKDWDAETRLHVAGGKDKDGNTIAPLAIKDKDGNDVPAFDGKTLPEVQKVAARALDQLGGEGLRTFLDETGMGNHPALVLFAYRAGKAIKEDSFERGGTSGKPASREELYYPSTKS